MHKFNKAPRNIFVKILRQKFGGGRQNLLFDNYYLEATFNAAKCKIVEAIYHRANVKNLKHPRDRSFELTLKKDDHLNLD